MQEKWVWPWVRKIPWKRKWQPTAVFFPAEAHGLRNWRATVYGVAKELENNWACTHDIWTRVCSYLIQCFSKTRCQFKWQLFRVHCCIQTILPRLCNLLSLIANTEPKDESLQEIQSMYKAFWYMGAYTQVHILTWNMKYRFFKWKFKIFNLHSGKYLFQY